jgi:hypothetical protein
LYFCQNLLAPQNQGKIVPPPGHFSKSPICKVCTLACNAAPCKPCTLQALKALFRGEYYFTLTKTPPIPVDIYFVHIKIIFSKNLLFSHFPSKKTWKKCTEILHKASNLHTSTKKATPLTSKTWFSKTLDKKRTKSDQK